VKVVFAGHNPRGVACLRSLVEAGHDVALVLVHPAARDGEVARAAADLALAVDAPDDVNSAEVVARIAALEPGVIVLAGYGQIVRRPLLESARHGILNLHAGKLPQYRGSSPLNWALINGEPEFTLSVIRVDDGVDTGDVIVERTLPIAPNDTIADLHHTANEVFPELLRDALAHAEAGTLKGRSQDEHDAGYYPLRFPDDGLVLWDLVTAEQAHNRIRALTDPYPGAFTFHGSTRIRLLASRPTDVPFYGDPGRVYRAMPDAILVCASDRCLWIDRAETDDGANALAAIDRYDRLATASWRAVETLTAGGR
jgi:methionyl-tRNA formyltransferase